MLTFADFKNSPASAFVEGLLKMSIKDIETWSEFQAAALENRRAFTRPDDDDWRLGFYETMWERFGTASSGERGLMLAVLHAIDYDALADKLGAEYNRTFFQIIDLADDSYRSAAAACIARLD
jgi:hypothetical protein